MRSFGVQPRRSRKANAFKPREVHVVIVPQFGPHSETFKAGQWNVYFEAMASLRDLIGEEKITVMDVLPSEDPNSWQLRLEELVRKTQATHVLGHIEMDPANQTDSWTWDSAFLKLLNSGWDGALLGVNFDSAFKWIRARSRRLAKISPQFVAVDICMPMTGELVSDRIEVGPVNMPVSQETVNMMNNEISGVQKIHDVSFIGALYPYRVELIEKLQSRGIDIAVNPHRPDRTNDFESSRTNQPSYMQYVRGLASSHMTINFSQSSAGPFEQLKTRVIEATLAGTYLLTDDKDKTRLFFEPDQFSTFDSVDELPELIESLLVDRVELGRKARSAQERARSLAVTDFWTQIDLGLRARGLPAIFSPQAKSTNT